MASVHVLQRESAQLQVDEAWVVLLPIGLLEEGFNMGSVRKG
jgi:hypothetical protein